MYSVVRRILSIALAALILTGMAFQAIAEEAQTSSIEASVEAAAAEKAPVDAAEPDPNKTPSKESEAPEPEALEPQAEAAAEPEAIDEADLADLIEISDEPVPLAGGPEPRVSVRSSRDAGALQIGDSLMLTCDLSGFGGLEYAIRWQARVNGKWKDLPGENSDTLVIRITDENAGWAYRAAVDAQPV